MNEKIKIDFIKLKQLKSWIIADLNNALYNRERGGGAQYLAALGLFDYIEMLGMFEVGYFKRDKKNGEILKYQHGREKERFDEFFKRLGNDYEKLLEEENIYNILRCGLTHELIPKDYPFTIAKADKTARPSKEELDNIYYSLQLKINNVLIPSPSIQLLKGVEVVKINDKKLIIVSVPHLYEHFDKAAENLLNDIENDIKNGNGKYFDNFLEVSQHINFDNFMI